MVPYHRLDEVLTILSASTADKAEISEYGKASHIFQTIKREKQVELELIIEFLEISYISGKTVEGL